MFSNAQGIAKKKNELRAFITDNEIDVALLSETFLKASHTFNIPYYITYRTDRNTKAGGGTASVDRDHEKFTDVINKQVHTEYRNTMNVQETTIEELRNIIETLGDRKAPGHNGITNTAIKHLTYIPVLPEDVET
ncbi:hypothetical protein Trydic_g17566 [Trypoxylus dichotomus]